MYCSLFAVLLFHSLVIEGRCLPSPVCNVCHLLTLSYQLIYPVNYLLSLSNNSTVLAVIWRHLQYRDIFKMRLITDANLLPAIILMIIGTYKLGTPYNSETPLDYEVVIICFFIQNKFLIQITSWSISK